MHSALKSLSCYPATANINHNKKTRISAEYDEDPRVGHMRSVHAMMMLLLLLGKQSRRHINPMCRRSSIYNPLTRGRAVAHTRTLSPGRCKIIGLHDALRSRSRGEIFCVDACMGMLLTHVHNIYMCMCVSACVMSSHKRPSCGPSVRSAAAKRRSALHYVG